MLTVIYGSAIAHTMGTGHGMNMEDDRNAKMEGGGMAMGKPMMTIDPTLRRTTICAKVPKFSLVDYSTDPSLHGTSHGITLDDDTDVLMVGLYFAD